MPWPHDTTPLRNPVQSFLTAKHEPARAGAIESGLDRWKPIPPSENSPAGRPRRDFALRDRIFWRLRLVLVVPATYDARRDAHSTFDSAFGLAQGRLASLAQGRHLPRRARAAIAGLALVVIAAGRSGLASDFMTEGVDAGRTGWVRDETVFTTANVANTRLLWRLGLESTPRAMHNLFAPLVAQRVETAQGTRELAVVAGVSDDLFGIDVATGRQIWHRHFDSTLANPGGTGDTLCPGGQTAVPTMAQISPGKYTIYAVSWDGRLRQVNLADGQDVAPPQKFIPGGGKPYALNLHDGVVYTATAQGCGGLTNAFYSFDLASNRASAFIPAGGGLWGRRGAAIDPEGRVFLGTGDAPFDPLNRRLGNGIVAVKLDAKKQLQLVDYFGAPNANWLWRRDLDVNTTPIAFDAKGSRFLVGTSKECRLWLLDRDALGGEMCTTLHTTPLICNDAQAFDAKGIWGALGAWQDGNGTQWVLAPFWGPVSKTFKAADRTGTADGGGVADSRCSSAGRLAVDAGLAVAGHGPRRRSGDRKRCRLRVCGG